MFNLNTTLGFCDWLTWSHLVTYMTLYNIYPYCIYCTAPSDYEGEIQVLEIFGNGVQTVSIDINDDSEVEDTESFFVNITTTDDYVNILIDSTQVLIGDNGEPSDTKNIY